MYKLLAIDIDDTVLRHDGTLSEENRDAIIRMRNNGVYVVIITGRSPKAARTVWEMLPVDRICVCFGGAVVMDMEKNIRLDATEVAPGLVKEALEFSHELGLVSQIYVGDDVMTEFENPYTERYTDYLGLKTVIEPNIRSLQHRGIPKVLCFSPAEKQGQYLDIFRNKFANRLKISASTKHFIELNHLSSDKGNGLNAVCEMLGVDIKDSIAMGDSLLDVPMIVEAGVGIAVDNASPEVKKSADVICPDCDSNAVAWVAERYFGV